MFVPRQVHLPIEVVWLHVSIPPFQITDSALVTNRVQEVVHGPSLDLVVLAELVGSGSKLWHVRLKINFIIITITDHWSAYMLFFLKFIKLIS